MKNTKKSLEKRLRELQGEFDIEMPAEGHFDRFEKRLKGATKAATSFWKPLAIAASLLLLFSFAWPFVNNNTAIDLKDISPQMEETQSYFVSVIDYELKKISKLETLDNEKIISDGLSQIQKLENDYKKLTMALKENSGDNRIIYAMIDNYQKRIEILKSILAQINIIKQSKYSTHENTLI